MENENLQETPHRWRLAVRHIRNNSFILNELAKEPGLLLKTVTELGLDKKSAWPSDMNRELNHESIVNALGEPRIADMMQKTGLPREIVLGETLFSMEGIASEARSLGNRMSFENAITVMEKHIQSGGGNIFRS